MTKIFLLLMTLLQDHYSSALTLHSMLSIVTMTMVFASLIPPILPHLAAYALIFWAGASLLFYAGTVEYLPATLLAIRADIFYTYFLFFG